MSTKADQFQVNFTTSRTRTRKHNAGRTYVHCAGSSGRSSGAPPPGQIDSGSQLGTTLRISPRPVASCAVTQPQVELGRGADVSAQRPSLRWLELARCPSEVAMNHLEAASTHDTEEPQRPASRLGRAAQRASYTQVIRRRQARR